MVKTGKYNGQSGTIISESDFNSAVKIIENNKNCYFIAYKSSRKDLPPFDKEAVLQMIRAGSTKAQIMEQTGLTLDRLNNNLFKHFGTSKLNSI